ncbi:Protein of unknown function [Pyronema omphalodes CBS 100304]|uniref:Uncharacterized protein n=1 Tax=Pyronema omphalodes (strain CBS 100304) TaxID=1076935 RepID=U4KUI5_PYROM|nr:Protein of unknown function [Pyronema omphalodes CBS 100304]
MQPKHPFGIPGSPRRSRLPQPADDAIPLLVVSLVAVAQITGQCCAAVHQFVGETTGNPGRIARLPRSNMRNRAFRGSRHHFSSVHYRLARLRSAMPQEPVLRCQTAFRSGLWLLLTVRHPGSLHLQEVWGPRLCKAGWYIYQRGKQRKIRAGLRMVESWKGVIFGNVGVRGLRYTTHDNRHALGTPDEYRFYPFIFFSNQQTHIRDGGELIDVRSCNTLVQHAPDQPPLSFTKSAISLPSIFNTNIHTQPHQTNRKHFLRY